MFICLHKLKWPYCLPELVELVRHEYIKIEDIIMFLINMVLIPTEIENGYRLAVKTWNFGPGGTEC